MTWPTTPDDLAREQDRIAALAPEPWEPPPLGSGRVPLVAAAGRDHPRRAGLAVHLGAVLDLPTVGVTDDPLVAKGSGPGPDWMARAPLRLGREVVAYAVRTRKGAKPIVAHAAWRTSPEVAAELALGSTHLARWPEPMREARRLARALRDRGRP